MRFRRTIPFMGIVFLFCGPHFSALSAENMAFRFADPQTADGATPGWIVADGEVTPESAMIFRSFLATNKDRWGARSVVLLNSPGGSLFGGVALGEAIREFGLGTR